MSAANLASRVTLAAVPAPRLRFVEAARSLSSREVFHKRGSQLGRGTLQIVAAKKNKRKEERKAQKRAETRALLKKRSESGDAQNETTEKTEDDPSGPAPYESTAAVMQSLTICGSYKEKTGEKLLDGTLMVQEAAEALWNAPFICASHDGSDIFNYGNKAALSLWGLSWDEFVGLPSTKSAEDVEDIQSERRELLDKAASTGVIRDYSGVRQTSKGRRFKINSATVWTISDRDGNKTGQAVRFDSFAWLDDGDGTGGEEMIVVEGGKIVPKPVTEGAGADAPSTNSPSTEDLEAAEKAVEEQAAEVRRLKEEEGLSNSDKEVQAAVEILLERKSALSALKQ